MQPDDTFTRVELVATYEVLTADRCLQLALEELGSLVLTLRGMEAVVGTHPRDWMAKLDSRLVTALRQKALLIGAGITDLESLLR